MSTLTFLVTELQALASETRRKHPEVREAAERSLAILRTSPEQATTYLTSDGPQSDDLLRPVFMGCATKNAKVVGISLGSLQRLISLRAVPQSAVPHIISTMSDAMSMGVDIQLKILQTLLSLITNLPEIHGELLADALFLCFKLQESRIAVVSSTAAATLRQLVMFVVDKITAEDLQEHPSAQLVEVTLPDGSSQAVSLAARDAYAIFEDLCLLVDGERPKFLKLESLHKTLALELIESVLTNHEQLFRKHGELLILLPYHLCPLLLKWLSDRPIFPLTIRCTRVIFLLLKQFSAELLTEAEVFLMLLIRIISNDGESGSSEVRPLWMRVMSLEIMRGLCSDSGFIRNVWARYDVPALSSSSGSKIFTSLLTALKRLLTEKSALLGVGTQIFGVGVSSGEDAGVSTAGMVAGMVATAASGVVSRIGAGTGLSFQASSMKIQCIDQLDKADSPPIPEAYVYLLGVQCLTSLCEGFSSFTLPLYSSLITHRPRSAGDPVVRARPALNLASLPSEDSIDQLRIIHAMIENGWPALLAALSFIIATNLSDELFVEVLNSFQAMTNVAGMLGLTTPRDAFLASLAKFAIPTAVVSSVDSYIEPPTPRSASFSENLGLTHQAPPPGLSERNLACLKVLLSIAMTLAGSLGESWFGVLEAMQNADYVLTKGSKAPPGVPSKWAGGPGGASEPAPQGGSTSSNATSGLSFRHPSLSDVSPENLLILIQRVFDASKNLDDEAFRAFIVALCRLSSEMVGMQTGEFDGGLAEIGMTLEDNRTSLQKDAARRRRVSGIHLPKTLRSGDFGISKLTGVAILNIHRLIYRSPDIAWDTTTGHLLSVIRLPIAPQSIRIQAARALDDILVMIPRNITTASELQAQVQRRMLNVLAQQIILDPTLPSSASVIGLELRKMGLETLHQILQASGHTLSVGWETIFDMLGSVAAQPPIGFAESAADPPMSPSSAKSSSFVLAYPNDKGHSVLVKSAFQSLTLACDSVSVLSPDHLRMCITTLGQFGRETDTNIALASTESLLWSVSDAIQSKRKEVDKEPEYSALWMFLLLEVLGLCNHPRPEVRAGSIATIFRAMQLYGMSLSLETWEDCIWKVTFPLLQSITNEIRQSSPTLPSQLDSSVPPEQSWDESKVLALNAVGSLFHDFLPSKIMHLDSFTKAWDVFVSHVEDTVLLDHRTITAPAFRSLAKSLHACIAVEPSLHSKVRHAWQRVWSACDRIGGTLSGKAEPHHAFSPPRTSASSEPYRQDSLAPFVDLIQKTRAVSQAVDGAEWDLESLTKLALILKFILTYPRSPDYRPDVDKPTLVQSMVLETIGGIDLSSPGSASLVMRHLSDFAFLPFSNVDPASPPVATTPSKSAQKRITYIAVFKKVIPMLVDLFTQFRSKPEIYIDGTVKSVLTAYLLPMKMKYDCPPASTTGKESPLWKSATTHFLQIVKQCAEELKTLGQGISDDALEGIWQQTLDVFRGAILADCSVARTFPFDVQAEEEKFDLSLLVSLEIDVVPQLGNAHLSDSLVRQLARTLAYGSRIYERDVIPLIRREGLNGTNHISSNGLQDDGFRELYGSTDHGTLLPRETFSYWCFDLLFLICSDVSKERSRRRLATLSLPYLLKRCHTTICAFVADEGLRGILPLPRAREEELLYVLRKLLELRLLPGTLKAAFSDEPSKYCYELQELDSTRSPSEIISDAVKRSSYAHLFHFFPQLSDVISIPRRMPALWAPDPDFTGNGSGGVEVSARKLAKECLNLIAQEMKGGADEPCDARRGAHV